MFDGIQFRGFKQSVVEDLALYSGVPVWNGLTDQYHPTQILADFLTMQENLGKLKGLKLVYVGDGRNNMANSLMIGSAKMGIHFAIAAPGDLFPEKDLVEECRAIASDTGAAIEFFEDPRKAVSGANAIYTDVWASMGGRGQAGRRGGAFEALPGQHRPPEIHGERRLHLPSLPAGGERKRSEGRGLRIQKLQGIR